VPNRNISFTVRNPPVKTPRNAAPIRSVSRAVSILECLHNGLHTLTDISHHTTLTKPTVYRLLQTLEGLLMVAHDPVTRRYHLGPLVTKLASNPETNHYFLLTCALEEMKNLWNATGENVELNIMVGSHYALLYDIISKHKIKVFEGADPVGPIFVGAAAKVLLGELDDKELKLFLKNIKIKQVTGRSVTDKKTLIAQIRLIRQQGYAISCGERIAGALSVSAPVRNYFWPVALSLVGPESRLTPVMDDAIKQVVATAGQITENIAEFFREKGVIVSEHQ
jgi:DNA-binding IclR family transcriptional regulator